MPQGLPRKLRHRFLIQAAVAGVLVVFGLAAGCAVTLRILIDARLQAQTESFWAVHEANPGYVPVQTDSVRIRFVPAGEGIDDVPPEQRLAPGSHTLPVSGRHLRVDTRPAGTVYVDMDFGGAKRVLWTATVLLMLLGLSGLSLLTWLTYRATRRLVLPITWLAGRVAQWDVEKEDPDVLFAGRDTEALGQEVRQLGGSLRELSSRVHGLVQRERDFTRDASHELRTPLTVIRVASDMLLADPQMPDSAMRTLQRIQRAGRDMETVIDAFLILARAAEVEPQVETFRVREVVDEEVERARMLLDGKPVELRVTGDAGPVLCAPPRVLGLMLGNLLSNACVFTEHGVVEVVLEVDRIVIRDTGIGMSQPTLQRVWEPFYRADQFGGAGKGMGLSIVRRLGERFDWPVHLDSEPGRGTTAEIRLGG